MPPVLHALRASLTFLTRIPVGGFPYPPKTWEWISIWFPLVGAGLGLLQALVWWGLDGHSDLTRAILAVTVGIVITGGFHEDGLSDTVDALGGAYDRENVLRILKDSRIGAFGALALIVALMLKVSLLVDLGSLAPVGLVLGQSLSRALPVMQLGLQPYARRDDPQSKSRDVARSGQAQALIVAGWVVAIAFGATAWGVSASEMGAALGAMMVVGVVLGVYFQRRAGGLTGDFMGALQQVSELGILMALVSA
ncbi:MAG: adenosylcobinamide-GDP ribazoletransferase [Myxococcota bacterium]|nr:adenosylcobinamide-GDP ribazoletransferase [Myxococcota bacterium]